MSKKKNIPVENAQPVPQPAQETQKKYSLPLDTLQAYYNNAYMKERERFNSMFGVLPNNPPFENPEYYNKNESTEEPVPQEPQVPLAKYKKLKGALTAIVILGILSLGAALFFAISYLV